MKQNVSQRMFSGLLSCLLAGGVLVGESLVDGTPARALERNCSYEIRVKSNGASVNSFTIPNGNIMAKGDQRAGGNVDAKRMAREHASRAARACVDQAIDGSGRSGACTVNGDPSSGQGAMAVFNLSNLRGTALNALCGQARQLGIGDRVRDYEIYLYVVGGSSDVTRDCQSAFGNRYLTLDRGGTILCSNGLFQPYPREAWSAWADASASQIRQSAAQTCSRNYPGSRAVIQRWEVNPANGQLRGYHSCQG